MRDNDSMIRCHKCKDPADLCVCQNPMVPLRVFVGHSQRPSAPPPAPLRKGSNPPPTFPKPAPPPNPPKRTYPYFDHNGIMYDKPKDKT